MPKDLEVSDGAGDIYIVLPNNSATYRLDVHSTAGDVDDGGIPQSQSSPNMITVTNEAGGPTRRAISRSPKPPEHGSP